ncbi:MAG: endonuclease/exonuclease/phosphatase family protein [Sulfurospirillum sp.]|nr:endonuclease/exonuclease/phosphatase family protein [Sulfurospirillum sp.]MBL0702718.1 endonuclease/exonuclease/phosphatase family protein [Sulfurospirillum sp.]
MIKFFTLFILPVFIYSSQFSVASFNVENLFDTKNSGNEYEKYIVNSKSGWNEKMLTIKIKNLARVIKDVDADIISLQEVENAEVLKRLNLALGDKKFPYMYSSSKYDGLDIVLLSKYPIKEHKTYNILKRFRPIHKVVLDIDSLHVTIFMNHWPSYRHPVKTRMKFAEKLKSLYEKEENYILIGDFNSPLKKRKKGWGQELELISKGNYNLWYDTPYSDRYSYKFFKIKNAIDHIIVSPSLHEMYINGTFRTYKLHYLVGKYGNAKRWQISKKGKGKHLGAGYSDHFAISAAFTTHVQNVELPQEITIKKLLLKKGRVNYILNNVMVIHISKYGILVEDKNRDTIYIYGVDCNFELGKIYSLHVRELAIYKGRKEITLIYCDKI